jgi:hypothetical protein
VEDKPPNLFSQSWVGAAHGGVSRLGVGGYQILATLSSSQAGWE